ncbi:7-dehydrocholesterol reductase [Aspergillus hancockii]|nr:7-dehydrocholesterol reductase [Aspergillus hancockii]
MLLVVILHTIYVADFFNNEDWYLTTIDITHDHFGCYLGWGSAVWLPVVYTVQSQYLALHAVDLSRAKLDAILAAGVMGYALFRLANNQKHRFRQTRGKCLTAGSKPRMIRAQYTTAKGEIHESLLLCSGFGGIDRDDEEDEEDGSSMDEDEADEDAPDRPNGRCDAGYGLIEVMQNITLDFIEADGDWKEQWAICEGTGFFMMGDMFTHWAFIEDGGCVDDTYNLLGAMFLTMLAGLESRGLLGPDSKVKNLGTIMALCLQLTSHDEPDVISRFHNFDECILTYARKYNIQVRGPPDIASVVEDLQKVDLPTTAGNDPWEKRAAPTKSFNKKDPLKKAELDAIKQGMILELA